MEEEFSVTLEGRTEFRRLEGGRFSPSRRNNILIMRVPN